MDDLPNRRASETLRFDHGQYRYFATISYDRYNPDLGTIKEIFLTTGKPGSELEAMARDMAVITSIALQNGVELETLRKALTRLDDGAAAGPMGKLLDLLENK